MEEGARILPAGDRATLVELGADITLENNRRVHSLAKKIE